MRLLSCLLTTLTVLVMGCGAQTPPAGGSLPDVAELEELARGTAIIEYATVNGADAFASSGPPSAVVDTLDNTRLVLDGDQAGDGFAWAVWRITLADGQAPVALDISFSGIGLRRYWIAYADFASGRWEFLTTNASEFGTGGSLAHIEPADPNVLLSPTRGIYVAVLSRPGQSPRSIITVSQIEVSYDVAGPVDPIFDDFEDNDRLEDAYELDVPGDSAVFHASIHESLRDDMLDPNEIRDRYDFYKLTVPAGKQATITLRHEPQDHFNADPPPVDFADLDLYLYLGGETDENIFDEFKSSYQVFPGGFEQIHLTGLSGPYQLGIVPDLADGYDDNAEYELSIFFSDSTYSVSGKVTQNGMTPMTDFSVFLEPGNFNDDTWMDGDPEPGTRGDFTIQGVPDGTYTLRVHGGARHSQSAYLYEATEQVTVSGGSVTQNIDIEPFPEP